MLFCVSATFVDLFLVPPYLVQHVCLGIVVWCGTVHAHIHQHLAIPEQVARETAFWAVALNFSSRLEAISGRC